jgi:transposase
MGSMQKERRFCAISFGVRSFWRSSVDCRPVWCLEACATAHYWGRELRALGHEVRLSFLPSTFFPIRKVI